ncbi:hypothetical protein [Brenneria uluponensis]|uniref:hypothetical protein n=1 Tax=Brenneria uluponensis TaxID=3057057 RepID=UPI0028E999AE|nr:hypothetical protein [Brenneria ulupoensis]
MAHRIRRDIRCRRFAAVGLLPSCGIVAAFTSCARYGADAPASAFWISPPASAVSAAVAAWAARWKSPPVP